MNGEPPPRVQPGYLPTLLGALAGALVFGLLAVLPVWLFAITRWRNLGDFIVGLLGLVAGLSLGIAGGAGLGAWFALRRTGYRFGGWTGLLVWPIQFVLLLLVVILPILLIGAPVALIGPVEALGLITAIAIPALIARAIVLSRIGSFVPPWHGWTHIAESSA